jgi:cobalt/nickel transport protein
MKGWQKILLIGLGVSLFLAVFLSPFASPWPDGLERVAEKAGFIKLAEGKVVLTSPIPDYLFPGVKNESLATALAGLIGTLITFLAVYGVGKLISRRKRS